MGWLEFNFCLKLKGTMNRDYQSKQKKSKFFMVSVGQNSKCVHTLGCVLYSCTISRNGNKTDSNKLLLFKSLL